MRAFNLSCLMIFINCGFYIMISMGVFSGMDAPTHAYSGIQGFIKSSFSIGLISISGSDIVIAIAILMIVGTALVLNSRVFSSQGVAFGVFTGVFWVSIGTTDVILMNIHDSSGNPFPGLGIFVTIYTIAAFFIFVIALVQLATGGQKSHV